MNKLNEMWAALTAYQPQADAAGHGESWAKMCKEKTYAAAADAASDADADAYDAIAYAAAYAIAYADAYAVDADAAAERWAQKAIECINKVLVKPPHNIKENT